MVVSANVLDQTFARSRLRWSEDLHTLPAHLTLRP